MGYPLPSGDAYESDLACIMLFYPDRPEYRQALFGALDYMATWLAWERDDDKRGRDAARSWRAAVEATRECMEMNTCELILGLLTEIRDNTGVYCCDPGDISNGDRYTDPVQDGEGDVPQNIINAGYADDAADWDGFADYKCMISHVMVDNLEAQVRMFQDYADESGAILGVAAAVAGIAAVILTGGGAVLVFGIVLAIAAASGLYAAIAEFGESGMGSLADDVQTNHDELACAIYNADGSSGAVTALKDKLDELFSATGALILKNLNLDAQLKALYAGRYDQQDIAEKMADEGYGIGDYDCTCPPAEYQYYATFLADEEYYDVSAVYGWHATVGNPLGSLFMYRSETFIRITNGLLRAGAGIGGSTSIEIKQVTLDYYRGLGTESPTAEVVFAPYGINETVQFTGLAAATWHDLTFVPASPAVVTFNVSAVLLQARGGTAGGGHFDNVRVWFDVL